MKRDTFQRKGISPLIAAVLLIAFTMAVAAILTAFVTTFTQERTEQVSDQGEQQINCANGAIDIINWDNDTVTFTNTGQVEFSNIRGTFLNGSSVTGSKRLGSSLGPGSTDSISSPNGYSTKARVAATDCPSKTDQETNP